MALIQKLNEIKSQTDALLTYANETTGAGDIRLGDAIRTLVDGFGGGSGVVSGECYPASDNVNTITIPEIIGKRNVFLYANYAASPFKSYRRENVLIFIDGINCGSCSDNTALTQWVAWFSQIGTDLGYKWSLNTATGEIRHDAANLTTYRGNFCAEGHYYFAW